MAISLRIHQIFKLLLILLQLLNHGCLIKSVELLGLVTQYLNLSVIELLF